MKELLFVCAVAAISVLGYCIMKKLDAFLANNRRLIDAKTAENSLVIALDNPMILNSLMPLCEKFSKANPCCQLRFLFGKPEDIYDKLEENCIDFGFIDDTASNNDKDCRRLIISLKQNSIFCENVGRPIEPLQSAEIQTAVIWKKNSSSAFVNSFSNFLLSNQASIIV